MCVCVLFCLFSAIRIFAWYILTWVLVDTADITIDPNFLLSCIIAKIRQYLQAAINELEQMAKHITFATQTPVVTVAIQTDDVAIDTEPDKQRYGMIRDSASSHVQWTAALTNMQMHTRISIIQKNLILLASNSHA